jgi:hypothetical protein
MRRLIMAALAATLTFATLTSTSHAQPANPEFRPLEMWVCSFRDRKDQGDMDRVYEMIRDNSGDEAYSAWQLNPYMTGSLGQNMDFIYLGAWESNTAMGAGLEDAMQNHPEIDEAWEEVVQCQGLMFASLRIQANPDGGDGNFMLAISDCKTTEGVGNGQALGAIRRFNDYRVANGQTLGTFAWFPVYGGGDADFSFKLATAYAGPRALGDAGQWTVDNAAYRTRSSINDGIVDCDESRLYTGTTLVDNSD